MKPPDAPEVRAWLQKAAEDRAAADLLVAHGTKLADAACYHCQQAAEKILKALLVASDSDPPRTHDLDQLLDLVNPVPPAPAAISEGLTFLKGFAVLARYPRVFGAQAPDRAERALRRLEQVTAWIERAYGWAVPRQPD